MQRAAIFVVERYLPGTSLDEVSRELEGVRAAAAVLSTKAVFVRHLSSIFVPEEESCTCLFEASSPDAVGEANSRASFDFARVIQGVHLRGGDGRSRSRPDV